MNVHAADSIGIGKCDNSCFVTPASVCQWSDVVWL